MAELTLSERIERIKALIIKATIEVNQLRSEDELDAVVSNVFDELQDLENRVIALENNLDMVEMTISTANG